jgi:cytoskeletal protein CcmA (bactofilin family)
MAIFSKEQDKNLRPNDTPRIQPEKAAIQPMPVEDRIPPPRHASPSPNTHQPHSDEGRAYLDRGSKVSGKLTFDGPARIDGHVDGEIHAKEAITIGESAVLTAQIRAASVIIAGKVSGDVVASQRIEIRPSAKVLGNITSPLLVIHEGAVFEGRCAMVETTRDNKVAVFPKEERLAQASGQKQA